jgi:ABC-2 type transport system ATP-binding protein
MEADLGLRRAAAVVLALKSSQHTEVSFLRHRRLCSIWRQRHNHQVTDLSTLLQLDCVTRRLAGHAVVRDLTLNLQRGEVLGLLGVNGAGKSTTLAMVAGARRPSSGRVCIDGIDLAEAPEVTRKKLGWLPERAPLWPELTVREHLDACGRLHGLHAAALRAAREQMIERLHLGDQARRLAGVLSQGQRQRLGLACALLHAPPLLVLDEPGNGLDPVQAADLRELIRERAEEGCGVILSTHLLPEVTAVCDRVAILHEGRLRHDAPLRDIDEGVMQVTLAGAFDPQRLRALAPVSEVEADGTGGWRLTLAEDADAPALARALVEAGLPVTAMAPAGHALERIFTTIATTVETQAA